MMNNKTMSTNAREPDDFEKRIAATNLLNEIRINEGITKTLDEMSVDEFSQLVAKSGIDTTAFGI